MHILIPPQQTCLNLGQQEAPGIGLFSVVTLCLERERERERVEHIYITCTILYSGGLRRKQCWWCMHGELGMGWLMCPTECGRAGGCGNGWIRYHILLWLLKIWSFGQHWIPCTQGHGFQLAQRTSPLFTTFTSHHHLPIVPRISLFCISYFPTWSNLITIVFFFLLYILQIQVIWIFFFSRFRFQPLKNDGRLFLNPNLVHFFYLYLSTCIQKSGIREENNYSVEFFNDSTNWFAKSPKVILFLNVISFVSYSYLKHIISFWTQQSRSTCNPNMRRR